MKFSEKMCLMIILKVTKNQGFAISLEDIFFEKPQGRSNWHPLPTILELKKLFSCFLIALGEIIFENPEKNPGKFHYQTLIILVVTP